MAEPKNKKPVGRPLKNPDPAEFGRTAARYFAGCDEAEKPYTMAGLASALGMSRSALCEYGHKEGFGDTVKAAREKVHEQIEGLLYSGSGCTGAIFSLKNNFGWKDRHEVDVGMDADLAALMLGARARGRK